MPRCIARLSASASSHHDLSLAAFITNNVESEFSAHTHTGLCGVISRCARTAPALNRQALEVGGEGVQPARAILGDDDRLREHAAVSPPSSARPRPPLTKRMS